jgi:hypothetical protein
MDMGLLMNTHDMEVLKWQKRKKQRKKQRRKQQRRSNNSILANHAGAIIA